MLFRLLFLTLLLTPNIIFCQVIEEVNPPDYIKTITFKSNTPESQLPILKLGEYLVLEFDALNGDEEDFYYKIEHYNFDWTESSLMKSEYLDGFDNQRIVNYENSFNTYQIYSHYKLTIPNQRTKRLKKSGNYIISIYDNYDELVFSRKFMIYENLANVGVTIKRSRDVKMINEQQTVDIVIASNSMHFVNPKNTIKTVIVQNNNLKTAISGLEPLYTIGNELIYKYNNSESSFWSGNEYLFFENKDIRAANTGVQFIELLDLYNNYLFTNYSRKSRPYTYNPDINGNFLITAIDAENSSIEADYAWIHFSLISNELIDKSVYVYGNFNNYSIDDSTRMTYNSARGIYENSLLMKQGFYNYKYVVVDKDNRLDEGAISGNFYQTENNYKVLVYYRDLGARYDKIIGVGEASSVNISN